MAGQSRHNFSQASQALSALRIWVVCGQQVPEHLLLFQKGKFSFCKFDLLKCAFAQPIHNRSNGAQRAVFQAREANRITSGVGPQPTAFKVANR